MISSFLQGLGRALRSPRLVLMPWLVQLLAALPAAVAVGDSIHETAGRTRTRESLLAGFDEAWQAELEAGGGLASTWAPSRIGVGAWLDNLDDAWSGRVFDHPPALLAAGALFALAWLLLAGGVLESFRRPGEPATMRRVLARGARHFWRFLRLALVSALAYYGIFALSARLFPWLDRRMQDVTSEWIVLAAHLAAACGVVLLLASVKLVSDYAKVVIVVERRRSALAAALSGLRFVASRPLATYGLALAWALVLALVFALYSAATPGVSESSPLAIVAVIAVTQLFLLARWLVRVGLLGSELALWEHRG